MLCVYQYMSDACPFQIVWLYQASDLPDLRSRLTRQPWGRHERRRINQKDREKFKLSADTGFNKGVITEQAHAYLTQWIQETLRREPRPSEYSFLNHDLDKAVAERPVRANPHAAGPPRAVRIIRNAGQPAAAPAAEEDTADLAVVLAVGVALCTQPC